VGAVDPPEIAVAILADLVATHRGVERVEPW
jgi:xanthine/CO dehydrogenase XdhC/CoxF family maturation factor